MNSNMQGCNNDPSTPKKLSPIAGEMNHLLNAIALLDNTVDTVVRRLDDVLSPELTINEDSNEATRGPEPPVSLTNARITEAARGLDKIIDHLLRLLHRLEV